MTSFYLNLNNSSGLKKTINYLTQQPAGLSASSETKTFNLSLRNLFDTKITSNVISASLSNINVNNSSANCSICKTPFTNNQNLLRFKWTLFNTNDKTVTCHKCNDCNQLTCKVFKKYLAFLYNLN